MITQCFGKSQWANNSKRIKRCEMYYVALNIRQRYCHLYGCFEFDINKNVEIVNTDRLRTTKRGGKKYTMWRILAATRLKVQIDWVEKWQILQHTHSHTYTETTSISNIPNNTVNIIA